MKESTYYFLISMLICSFSACSDTTKRSESEQQASTERTAAQTPDPEHAAPDTLSVPPQTEVAEKKPVDVVKLPFDKFKPKKFNKELADKGAVLFTACEMCHSLDNRMIGPALRGVTERRDPTWVVNMILAPDVMIQNDSIALALYEEYQTPMTKMNLTKDDVIALYEYLRKEDGIY